MSSVAQTVAQAAGDLIPFAPESAEIQRAQEFFEDKGLSSREVTVVLTAIAGLDTTASGAAMGCAERTVGWHWQNVFRKTSYRCQRDVLAAVIRHLLSQQREQSGRSSHATEPRFRAS